MLNFDTKYEKKKIIVQVTLGQKQIDVIIYERTVLIINDFMTIRSIHLCEILKI